MPLKSGVYRICGICAGFPSIFLSRLTSIINPLAVANSGVDLDWLGWFKVMGLPAIVASVLTLLLILVLFKPSKELEINLDEVKEKQNSLGPLSTLEKRTAVWLVIAIVLWATDSIHGINIGWVTLGVAMFMSMPVIGEVLTANPGVKYLCMC